MNLEVQTRTDIVFVKTSLPQGKQKVHRWLDFKVNILYIYTLYIHISSISIENANVVNINEVEIIYTILKYH